MRPFVVNFTPAALNTTGFASAVTGATWTLTANSAGDNLAHQVTVRNLSATDHSAKTAVLVGTDGDGNALTETINLPGPSPAIVTSVNFFKTLTSITPSATIGVDTMNIGWNALAKSQSIPVERLSDTQCTLFVHITGTINYTIEEMYENPFSTASPQVNCSWNAITALTSKAADTLGQMTEAATAFRFSMNSVTAGATTKIAVTQATRSA